MTARSGRIRRAVSADGGALSDLAFRSKASNGYDAAFMEACRAELIYDAESIAASETWLLERDGAALGFYELRLEAGVVEIYAFFVEPTLRGGGVGRRLWLHLETRARAMGASLLATDSDPFAEGFYVAMGMRRTGAAPSGSIPGRFLPRMEMALGPARRATSGRRASGEGGGGRATP